MIACGRISWLSAIFDCKVNTCISYRIERTGVDAVTDSRLDCLLLALMGHIHWTIINYLLLNLLFRCHSVCPFGMRHLRNCWTDLAEILHTGGVSPICCISQFGGHCPRGPTSGAKNVVSLCWHASCWQPLGPILNLVLGRYSRKN